MRLNAARWKLETSASLERALVCQAEVVWRLEATEAWEGVRQGEEGENSEVKVDGEGGAGVRCGSWRGCRGLIGW